MTETKISNLHTSLEASLTARAVCDKKNETSKMIQKFAASDDLKMLQAEVISECEGLLNVSVRMLLAILCLKLTI